MESLCTAGRISTVNCNHYGKQCGVLSKKLNIELPNDPAILLLVIFFQLFFLLLLKYSFLNFLLTALPHPNDPHLPPSILPHFGSSMGPLYMFFEDLSPCFPFTSCHLPSDYCQFVLYFMSLVIFCLLVCFVDQVPLIGEIIRYLSFTAWITSLSIMLSRSIMLSQRVGAPSFFLLHSIPLCKGTAVF